MTCNHNWILPDHPRGGCRAVLLLPHCTSCFSFFCCSQFNCLLSLVDPDRPDLGFCLHQHFHHILHIVDALQHCLVAQQVTLVQSGQMGHKVPARVDANSGRMVANGPVQVKLNYCVTSFREEIFHYSIQVDDSATLDNKGL